MTRMGIAIGILIVCTTAVHAAVDADTPAVASRTIAVVKLKNLRPATDTDWIGEGAAETLTTKLAGVTGLVTVERTHIKAVLKEQAFGQLDITDAKTAAKVGKLLGALRIVVGSYVFDADRLLFNVRVVEVETAAVLHAASVTGQRDQVFDVLFRLAEAVVQSFDRKVAVVYNTPISAPAPTDQRIVLSDEQKQELAKPETTSVAAYEAFARGAAAETPDEKIQYYNQAVAADPDYAHAYMNRAVVYVDQGKPGLAVADLDRVIAIQPRHARAYYWRGLAYTRAGKPGLAIASYTAAIRLKPTYAIAYSQRGVAYASSGRHERAITDYNRSVRLAPRDAAGYYYRAQTYARQNQPKQAIQDYNRALQLRPNYGAAHYDRAQAYYQAHDYARAWADVQAAQRLGYPVNPAFTNQLNRAMGRRR